ncbi:hypothetical protein AAAT34_12790 [Hallella faecis]|uniref:Cohesin domain-containing protein n=2 Tax=Hallella faecis TaxID=2841596 RepID=A0ABV1FU06_9BACT|nr:hypothetical protein [Hallella faecis]
MAFAQQAELVNLSVEPITIETGETKTISINMTNPSVDVASFILGVELPAGLTFVQDKLWNDDDEEWNYFYASLTDRKLSKFVLSENYDTDKNTLKMVINGMGQVFKGTEGAIVSFTIAATETATSGQMKIYDQSWSNADASLGGERPDINVDITVTLSTKMVPTIVNNDDANVYTLDGRKISDVRKSRGIYIVNGKKMIIK